MARFSYGEKVRISDEAPPDFRPGADAWIVSIVDERKPEMFSWLPEGTVYTVEFEDSESMDLVEQYMVAIEPWR